ncbi:MAG TPA: tRNA guanosine(15) transglycosylase TgtA [Nitrososphaera sp.]|nr:tRNA guanosine(15) transglycosylase TgtA [Nitrososphaera sp.]
MVFEVRHSDLAGRIGKLETPHGTVETPAFVPVVHPVRQTVSTQFLKKMGFDLVITNAYITLRHYGDEARRRGIHDIIGFDGAVMTDSGGYQVLEYGSVEVEPAAMAQFEKDIKSDIPIPLDKPTGYGLDYETARQYVDTTLKNCKETLQVVGADTDAIWVGPVQGAEHSDLVEHSASALDSMGFKLMALGSPVELMEAYEFATLARMIAAAKKVIPAKPVHLFGAGHPLTIPLAVALGCDMFDSASYMLYAKDGRYMTPNSTMRLDEMTYLPCQCEVCSTHSVRDLKALERDERIVTIAKHNLHVLKAEVDAVKQSILDGRLWEYVMQKARAHPKLMEAARLFSGLQMLEPGTPLFKEKAIYLYEPLDQYRPEVKRYREMVSRFRTTKRRLVLCPETDLHPFYSTRSFRETLKRYSDAQVCSYNPFLGIIPAEISDVFPAAHNIITRSAAVYSPVDYPTFVQSLNDFVKGNNFEEIILVMPDCFIEAAAKDAALTLNVTGHHDRQQ